jgi:hypothetical protein
MAGGMDGIVILDIIVITVGIAGIDGITDGKKNHGRADGFIASALFIYPNNQVVCCSYL